MLKIKSMNDTSSEDVLLNALNIWMQSSDEWKAILNQVSKQVVDSFIDFSYQKAVLTPETDRVADYAKRVLSLGCF